MLPAKHVILKRVETGPARGRDGLESVQPRLSFAVEVDALTTRRVEEVSHHRDIAAVAPVIPMKLIAPVGLPRAAAHPTSTSTAWGIHAVGADRSSLSEDRSGAVRPVSVQILVAFACEVPLDQLDAIECGM